VCQTSTFTSEDACFCINDDSMHFSKKDFGKERCCHSVVAEKWRFLPPIRSCHLI
jgi:hypothetical protein